MILIYCSVDTTMTKVELRCLAVNAKDAIGARISSRSLRRNESRSTKKSQSYNSLGNL